MGAEMNVSLATVLLVLVAATSAHAAGAIKIESVELKTSPAIHWEGHNHETIEAVVIGGPLSIRLENCSDVTISVCDLASIEVAGCKDVTIRNCYIHDAKRIGVEIASSSNVHIEGCRMEQVVSGVYAVDSKGVQVIGSFVRNVQGPFPRGQMAQFDNVSGSNNVIRDNYAINERGKSTPEDVINIYQSTGTEESPILIENNYLSGDPVDGSTDKSVSGSGIMLGDCGGAHILCRGNVILSAGQVGLGVAGGSFIRVEDNLILGQKSNVSNVGLYVWNQSKKPSDHVTVVRNRVSWTNKDAEENSWWNGGGARELEQSANHFADATLHEALPAPPSQAPLPPKPWAEVRADGKRVVRLPWKQK
jgi:hypothetical protein